MLNLELNINIMAFKDNCAKCQKESVFLPIKNSELCGDKYYFGFSFFGGVRFYTFREISVSLGIIRKAKVGKCEVCKRILVRCPYCSHEMSINDAKAESCNSCEKKFYLCT